MASGRHLSGFDPNDPCFSRKRIFLSLSRPCSWRVSQSPIRVVIIIIMDHSYNNNNKWRLHAIFSDPRVWINRGSTMDQHGSTWISRLQHVAFSLPAVAHVSGVMRPASDSWLMAHGSCVRRQTHGSCVMRHASCVRRQTHGSWLMAHGSWLMAHGSWLMAHASCVMRQTSHVHSAPFSRRPLSVMTTTKRRHFSHATAPRFAPVELYGMG